MTVDPGAGGSSTTPTVTRWKFYDPVADESFTFAINPISMSTPYPPQQTVSQGQSPITGMIGATRAPRPANEWSFSGFIRTEAFQTSMEYWFAKNNKVHLTDHIGRTWIVVPELFGPYPRPNRRSNDHRWQYDAKVYNYGRYS